MPAGDAEGVPERRSPGLFRVAEAPLHRVFENEGILHLGAEFDHLCCAGAHDDVGAPVRITRLPAAELPPSRREGDAAFTEQLPFVDTLHEQMQAQGGRAEGDGALAVRAQLLPMLFVQAQEVGGLKVGTRRVAGIDPREPAHLRHRLNVIPHLERGAHAQQYEVPQPPFGQVARRQTDHGRFRLLDEGQDESALAARQRRPCRSEAPGGGVQRDLPPFGDAQTRLKGGVGIDGDPVLAIHRRAELLPEFMHLGARFDIDVQVPPRHDPLGFAFGGVGVGGPMRKQKGDQDERGGAARVRGQHRRRWFDRDAMDARHKVGTEGAGASGQAALIPSPLPPSPAPRHPAPMLHASLPSIPVHRPAPAALDQSHHDRLRVLASAEASALPTVLAEWEQSRRDFETQRTLAAIRFSQDTREPAHKADRQFFDDLAPTVQEHDTAFLRALLSTPLQDALNEASAPRARELWALAISAFDPAITQSRRDEAHLVSRYDEIRASIRFDVRGESHSLASVRGLYGRADRSLRHDAARAESRGFDPHRDELDEIFDRLVRLRTGMAHTLSLPNFVPLGYRWMRRTDWGPSDAAAFRAAVLEDIVPLAAKIRARRASTLGINDLAFHDEGVRDDRGVPRPVGDAAWVMQRAEEVCEAIHPELGHFFRTMRDRAFFDLEVRPGKVGGGFATPVPGAGLPFIFANWNGSQDDVVVLMHELGHGFQMMRSLAHRHWDFVIPTEEAAEVHSMSLELLSFPHMERFFGDDAARFRAGHLEHNLLFLPYACLIDAFQHEVYGQPTLGAAGRAELWRDLEARFLPWRRYDDTPWMASGRFWQRQLHLFHAPFYYLDYALAECCALQLWSVAQHDATVAVDRWYQLCGIGGSQSFTAGLASAGLENPMLPGALRRIASEAARVLDLI